MGRQKVGIQEEARIPSDVTRDIRTDRPKKGKISLMKPTRVRDSLVERVKLCLAEQMLSGLPPLEEVEKQWHKAVLATTLAVIDTIIPRGEPVIRNRIINLLNQPIVGPITMDAVREWKEMVADQILAAVADSRPLRCEFCGKYFKNTQGRGVHVSFVHKIRPVRR